MAKAKTEMLTVFMSQESAKTEADAKKILKAARKGREDFVGGRVLAPGRAQRKVWWVQAYYADDGGKPPLGMARLTIPSNTPSEYGIKAA